MYLIVVDAAKEHEIECDLLFALIYTESGFNSNAISNKGACGLMQIMPETAAFIAEKCSYIGVIDLLNPKCNLFLGCKYLRYLMEKFIELDLVLCAYNAGEGRVSEWLLNKEYSKNGRTLNKIPYKETNEYLKKIINRRKIFKLYFKLKGCYE